MVSSLSRFFRPLAGLGRVAGGEVTLWRGTLLAIGAAAITFLLHWTVVPFFHPDRGLIVFIPAIVLVTLIAGPGFGALTAAFSGLLVWYLTLPPVNEFALSHADAVSLCIYVFSSAIVILLVYWLRESRAQERLLRKELQHRTKNLFALVHGLAQQTLRGDAPIDRVRDAFIGRLMALNRANETMGESGLDRVDLDYLVRSVLKSFSDHFVCHGAEAYLDGQTARNLSLALHELATNSAKYGAFSSPEGSVIVTWETAAPGAHLSFVWKETGGPTVAPPIRIGFGSKLLKTLFGRGEVEFARDGLVYRVQIPPASP